jgi:hypothetical protein
VHVTGNSSKAYMELPVVLCILRFSVLRYHNLEGQ